VSDGALRAELSLGVHDLLKDGEQVESAAPFRAPQLLELGIQPLPVVADAVISETAISSCHILCEP
jgi:hypothetical protein